MYRYPVLALLAASLATSGTSVFALDAGQVLAAVRHAVFTVIATGDEHGVVNVLAQGQTVEHGKPCSR